MTGKRGMTGLHGNHKTGPKVARVVLVCAACACSFERTPGFMRAHPATRYCSKPCAGKAARKPESTACVSCSNCGRSFSKRTDHLSSNNYCSKGCSDKARAVDGAKWRDARQIAEYNKAYREKNAERLSAIAKDWVAANKEKRKQIQAKYREVNADQIQVAVGARRAAIKSGDLTNKEWADVKAVHGFRYAHCGAPEGQLKLTLDHIKPLARGGAHTKGNVQPLCKPCNSRKGVKDNEEVKKHLMAVVHGIHIREV